MIDLGTSEEAVLLFGGPYSNLAATAAMQRRSVELGIPPQRIICNGDVVAYCGEPCETLDLIRDWGIHLVMGNCEESLAFGEADCGCGFDPGSECSLLAVTWYDYARRHISDEQRRWMRKLPRAVEFSMQNTRFQVIHGSLNSINEFVFASSDAATRLEQIRNAGIDVVIGGHSGIPFGQRLQERYWLNTGVIGMPANDGGRHGWYLLLEAQEQGLEASWHRLDYDYEVSRTSTVAAGMNAYGQALVDGLWPSVDILPEVERRQSGRPLDLRSLRIETPSRMLSAGDDRTTLAADTAEGRKSA
jgi:predicted phosphodiesterase